MDARGLRFSPATHCHDPSPEFGGVNLTLANLDELSCLVNKLCIWEFAWRGGEGDHWNTETLLETMEQR